MTLIKQMPSSKIMHGVSVVRDSEGNVLVIDKNKQMWSPFSSAAAYERIAYASSALLRNIVKLGVLTEEQKERLIENARLKSESWDKAAELQSALDTMQHSRIPFAVGQAKLIMDEIDRLETIAKRPVDSDFSLCVKEAIEDGL